METAKITFYSSILPKNVMLDPDIGKKGVLRQLEETQARALAAAWDSLQQRLWKEARAEAAQAAYNNPPHLGNKIDTWA